MTKEDISRYLSALGEVLSAQGLSAEICLAGGASMIFLIGNRPVTKDIDAYFAPQAAVRSAAEQVARRFDLPADWLNDGVKGFFYTQPPQRLLWHAAGISVYSVEPDYLLAMKALSGRDEDRRDLKALIAHLGLTSVESALEIVTRYIPPRVLTPKVNLILEEIFSELPP